MCTVFEDEKSMKVFAPTIQSDDNHSPPEIVVVQVCNHTMTKTSELKGVASTLKLSANMLQKTKQS